MYVAQAGIDESRTQANWLHDVHVASAVGVRAAGSLF
jgi:hypothetical protein